MQEIKEGRKRDLSELLKPRPTKDVIVGINGLGRVGLRLFRHWLENYKEAAFRVEFINDIRSAKELVESIKDDAVLGKIPNEVKLVGSTIIIDDIHSIKVTNVGHIVQIPWHNDTDVVFECTGKFTKKADAEKHLRGRVERVIISATSWDADALIVLGVNHESYDPTEHEVISYGSCTVNPFTVVAKILHDQFVVVDASVHVTHGMPLHQIEEKGPIHPIEPRECTLEKAGPLLLSFLKDANFYVTYHLVPTPTASIMEMEFTFRRRASKEDVIKCIEAAIHNGLGSQIAIVYGKHNSNDFIASKSSIVIDADNIRFVGKKVLVRGYFDNEHSILRAYDLLQYMLNFEV